MSGTSRENLVFGADHLASFLVSGRSKLTRIRLFSAGSQQLFTAGETGVQYINTLASFFSFHSFNTNWHP